MPRLRLLSLLAFALPFAAVSAETSGTRSDNPKQTAMDRAVDTAAATFFESRCHAGLSIAVVTASGEHIYDYGFADRQKGTPPMPDSVYEIASVTKSFTASLAAAAVHDGKLSLDGDIRKDLPGSYPNLIAGGRPVTLATLLTHRSGMPRDIPDSDAIFAAKDPHTLPAQLRALMRGQDEKRFLKALHDTRLRSTPGTEETYSNAGFILIGAALEHVYKVPYANLLQQRILTPLNMTSTTLTLTSAQQARRVIGYDMFGQPAPDHPSNAGAAWGLWSTPADLAKYVRWQLDETDPVVALSHQPLADGKDERIAMAWHLEQIDGRPVISHGGGSFGASSHVVLFPQSHTGFALLANDTCKGTEGALKQLALTAERQAGTRP
ncbi:beta-lactamase family protein [Luteibacter pinisoli]|uniref:Beta-lactamase family protein n=1 Tax=Luteibacter pinisoli TaxID=2589080 RepID=A0A4Y5Z0P4_9GAMM|nr:serine hydrolase domain-containing protein [Luteibacter pinisoli]QDE38842.1 beta-lactamase family protein [Luteibacter pinisoli]